MVPTLTSQCLIAVRMAMFVQVRNKNNFATSDTATRPHAYRAGVKPSINLLCFALNLTSEAGRSDGCNDFSASEL